MTDVDLAKYIYWEYSLVVIIFSEIIKQLAKGSTNRFVIAVTVTQPKWVSLFVATICSVLDWALISKGNNFNLWQFLISFGVAVLGYDYVIKLIKDIFKRTT